VTLADTSDNTMLLSGQKDDVFNLFKNSLLSAFPDGQFADGANFGYVGYQTTYSSMWTGLHMVGAKIEPMTTDGYYEATAYLLRFGYKTDGRFANGSQDVKKLMEEISNQATKQGNVTVMANRNLYRSLSEETQVCYKQLQGDPNLQLLAGKIALSNSNDATLLMLADDSKPTPPEKELISLWSAKRDKCAGLFRSLMSFYPTDPFVRFGLETASLSNELILRLYKGELTFGEFNKQRQTMGIERLNKSAELKNNLNNEQQKRAEIERQHQLQQQQINIEQQRANTEVLQAIKLPAPIQGAAPYQMPSLPASNRINIDCTTRAIGNTVNTNCN
jgi:hypothetical protein